MAGLNIKAIENAGGQQGYTAAPAGLTVNAYLASQFTSSPTSASFNPRMTPAATSTTNSSGACTLGGLAGGTSYAVCVIDKQGQPHFQVFPGGYVGDGLTHVIRYIPAPAQPGIPVAQLPSASIFNNASPWFPLTSTSTPISWGVATPRWQDAPFTWDPINAGWDIGRDGIVQVSAKAFFVPGDNNAVDYPGYAIFAIYDAALNTRLDYIQREFDTVAISGDDQSFSFTTLLEVTTAQILQIQVATSFPTGGSGASWVLPKFDVVYLGPS